MLGFFYVRACSTAPPRTQALLSPPWGLPVCDGAGFTTNPHVEVPSSSLAPAPRFGQPIFRGDHRPPAAPSPRTEEEDGGASIRGLPRPHGALLSGHQAGAGREGAPPSLSQAALSLAHRGLVVSEAAGTYLRPRL